VTPPRLSPLTRSAVATDEAPVSHSAATFTVVTGATGLQIVVFDIVLTMDAAGTFKWNGSVTGDLTGAFSVPAAGYGIVALGSPRPILWAAIAEDLKLITTSANIAGWITYATIDPFGQETD